MSFTGFTFLGKHSYRDYNLTIASRDFPAPNKIKNIVRPPFSNIDIDFSEICGDQIYENRTISYSINIFNRRIKNKAEMNNVKTVVTNWLMNTNGKEILTDDNYPHYYFLAEAESGLSFRENWNYGTLDITFTGYPFMIHELSEGNDIWDSFNFDLDVAQETSFTMDGEYTFKEVNVGDNATIGAWATTFASGGGKIPLRNIGVSGTITDMEYVESSRSKRAYRITGIEGLVVEQDIIQAHIDPLEIVLINPGTPSVVPTVDLTAKATVVKGIHSYNFVEGGNYTNNDFRLDSGENNLTIYSFHKNKINFNFRKELI